MTNDNLPVHVIYDEKRAYYDMEVRLKGSERGATATRASSFHLKLFSRTTVFAGVSSGDADRSFGAG